MLPPRLTALALLVAATLPSAHAATDVVWTETVITDHSDVDLDGTLVLAYNASNNTGNIGVTVDGILYAAMPPGVLSSGWTGGAPYNYCVECTGAFNTLMDSLVYNPDNTVTGIDLDGLVIGQSYKVQLLMSNDQNTTGATEQWSLGGVSHVQDGWAIPGRNETVILSATFTATQTTETIQTGSVSNGDSATDRAVFNAVMVRTYDDDTDGDGFPDSIDVCPGVDDDQTDTDGDGFGDACASPFASIAPDVVHMGNYIGARAVVGAGADIGAGVVIGRRAVIGADATLGADSVIGRAATIADLSSIGANVSIGYGSIVNASTVGDRAVIGTLVQLGAGSTVGEDAIVARGVQIGASSSVGDDTVIGPETLIGASTSIGSLVRIRKQGDIADDVTVGDDVRMGRSVILESTTEVRQDATLGANVTVQTTACVDASARVARGTTVSGACAL